MMTFSTDAPESCGILELDQQGIVCNMHEKVKTPPGNLANGAVYILEPEVVNAISSLQQDTIDLSTDVIPQYFGKIATFHNDEFHRDIGTLSSMQRAEQEFSSLYSLNS
jgi:mannose-1-phosphate guanylyltransferase